MRLPVCRARARRLVCENNILIFLFLINVNFNLLLKPLIVFVLFLNEKQCVKFIAMFY